MNDLNAPSGEIILYQTEDGETKLEVRLEDETVWLTQQQLATLLQTTKQNVGQHLRVRSKLTQVARSGDRPQQTPKVLTSEP